MVEFKIQTSYWWNLNIEVDQMIDIKDLVEYMTIELDGYSIGTFPDVKSIIITKINSVVVDGSTDTIIYGECNLVY